MSGELDYKGSERRQMTLDVQRDLGRIEGDIKALTSSINEVKDEMRSRFEQRDREFTAFRADLDTKLGTILSTLQSVETKTAEARGGLKMLTKIVGGGGAAGGAVAYLLNLLDKGQSVITRGPP
jgi:hypothetical protein